MKLLDRAPEIDMSELESLFSASIPSNGSSMDKGGARKGSNINKPEIVHLVFDTFSCRKLFIDGL